MGLTLGLIGCGGISSAHIDAIGQLGGRATIALTVDPDAAAAERAAAKCDAVAFSDWSDAVAAIDAGQPSVDGLIVAAPPSVREPIVAAALERQIPLLLEKPLAHTCQAAERINTLSRSAPCTPIHVAYCHRFTPAMVEMRRMIEAGRIGQPLRFENVFASWHPKMERAWMSEPALSGGGVFIDTGSHSIDLFHFLLGPCRVSAAVLSRPWTGRGSATATVLVRGGDADAPIAGCIASSWREPERFTVDVVGSSARLRYDFAKPTSLQQWNIDGTHETIEVAGHERRFRDQMAAFLNAIEGADAGPLATLADGLAVAKVIADVEPSVDPAPARALA